MGCLYVIMYMQDNLIPRMINSSLFDVQSSRLILLAQHANVIYTLYGIPAYCQLVVYQ